MTASALHPESLPSVRAKLTYAAPMAARPFNYTYGPPPGMPRGNTIPDLREVAIHSARPIERDLSLDEEGFAIVPQKSAVADFWDEDELRRVYYPEMEALVARETGPPASSCSITRCAAALPQRRTAPPARRASRSCGCITITPRSRDRSGCAT